MVSEPSSIQGYEITECQQDQEETSLLEVVACCIGGMIGLMNAIVVAVIAKGGRKLRKATFLCICNLAVADMLAGLLLLWIFGLQKVRLIKYNYKLHMGAVLVTYRLYKNSFLRSLTKQKLKKTRSYFFFYSNFASS